MPELLASGFYWFDLAVGFGGPIILLWLRRSGRIGRSDWRIFWLGVVLGACWEIPVFVLSKLSGLPIIVWRHELPVHYLAFLTAHLFWDGGILLTGFRLMRWLYPPLAPRRFRWAAPAVLIVWGQLTALLVESSSILCAGWIYVTGYWWNPTLLRLAGEPLTLLPQLLWLWTTVAGYRLAVAGKCSGKRSQFAG